MSSSSNYIYIFSIPGAQPGVESVETGTLQTDLFCETRFHGNSFGCLVSRDLPNMCTSRRAAGLLPTFFDVPTDFAPSPARRRDCSVEGSVAVTSPGISTSSLRSSITVTTRTLGRDAEFFSPPARSTPVEEENQRLDVNGNDAATVTSSACCCLPYQLSSTATTDCQSTGRQYCSSSFAKDCWQRLCDWACCLPWLSSVTFKSFHCLLVLFASLGVGCIISGVVLGILRMVVYGSFLVLSVMFVGLGVLLIVVVIVGWRCIPAGEEPCHRLLDRCINGNGSRSNEQENNRRPDRNQWFGGLIYPEFRSRTPPPPYSLSVPDFSIEARMPTHPNTLREFEVVPNTPPPAYRGRAPNSSRVSDAVLPPSYRAHDRLRQNVNEAPISVEVHGQSVSSGNATSLHGEIPNSRRTASANVKCGGGHGAHRHGTSHKHSKTSASRGLAGASRGVDGRTPGPSSAGIAQPNAVVTNPSISASDVNFRSVGSSSMDHMLRNNQSCIATVDDDDSVNDKLDSVV